MRDGDLDEVGVGLAHGEGDGDVAIYRNAEGQMIMAPTAFGRLSPAARETLGFVQESAAGIQEWQTRLSRDVDEARAAGISWALIGWSVGITGEAARLRWGARE